MFQGSTPEREVLSTSVDDWSDDIRNEFSDQSSNGRVGGRLLLENDRVRVWEIRLEPGERYGAHRHVLDYFWVAVTEGTSLQHTSDGRTERVHYRAGDTMFFSYQAGESMLHDLANAGDTLLIFTTVELKESANQPLVLVEE
jgi:uncharacterized cupin superfamily protein